MRHHTKDKGDAGLGFIIADLMSNNIQVALPISEHLPFDCIAISENNELKRISVKYRTKNKIGQLHVPLSSSWADRKGTHTKKHKKDDYDAIAIYCPTTKKCYYINMEELKQVDNLNLRIDPTRNNQEKGIKKADNYLNPLRIFAPIAQLEEHQSSKLDVPCSSHGRGTISDSKHILSLI